MGNKFVPLGIVIIAFLAFVSVKPLTLEVRTTNAEIKAYQDQSGLLTQKIDKLKQLKPELASAKTELDNLKMAMPAAQQIPEVLVMVEALAMNNGLKITGTDITPDTAGNEVGVNMIASGSYDNLAAFTVKLEQNLRPIKIKSLNITSSAETSEISAAIGMGILYQGKQNQQVSLDSN